MAPSGQPGALDVSGLSQQERFALLNDIGSDLPDGAYLALAEELGIDWSKIHE